MPDILTVTLNPTVDLSTSAERVLAGPKLRCALPEVDPGGGGINVARAIHILGGRARAFVAAGGHTGQRLLALLAGEGVASIAHPAPGDTRESLSVIDRETGAQYRFVMPGPDWPAEAARHLMAAIAGAAEPGGYVVLSGSQPPGLPRDFPTLLAAALGAKSVRFVCDTSGPALEQLARRPSDHPPFVLRMDGEEAEGLAGRALPGLTDSADFAQTLARAGAAEMVIVAHGPEGSVLATRDRRLHAAAAKVPVVSKVGAGDSFVGAFALALAQGADAGEALSRGSAAASAAVMTPGTRLCLREDAERLVAECPRHPI